MTTSDKALAWWAALTPDKILLLYIDNELGGIEENPINENYNKAEYLWQELLGVIMVNESGRTLTPEEIKSCKESLENNRPIKD